MNHQTFSDNDFNMQGLQIQNDVCLLSFLELLIKWMALMAKENIQQDKILSDPKIKKNTGLTILST